MSATISTIPASFFVNVNPGVISAGQPGETLIALFLTTNIELPTGSVLSFPNLAAVQAYFGASSLEATEAAVYFAGYNGCTKLPSALLFAQYPLTATSAYLRGGLLGLTLTQLQAVSGLISIVTDAGTFSVADFTGFASATSFANAAQRLLATTGFQLEGPIQAVVTAEIGWTATGTGTGTSLVLTAVVGFISIGDQISGTGVSGVTTIVAQTSGTTGAAGTYTTSSATTSAGATITAESSVLNVTAITSGTVAVGQQSVGSGITLAPIVTSQISGTAGGIGLYQLALSNAGKETVVSETVTMVTPAIEYNTMTGSFQISSGTTGPSSTVAFATGPVATSINLTQATGAVQSLGAAAAVPATFMAGVIAINQNWATVATLFDPDGGSGNAQKLLFAAWANSTNNKFAYVCTDTDITPTESVPATSSMGYLLQQSNSSGTMLNYQPVGGANHLASFACGFAASVNFDATNGRATQAYKSQSGIVPSVNNATALANLIANGYNSYDSAATAGAAWQFAFPGQISGPFSWFDSYINQIWLNNQLTIALMTLLTSVGRIPYNLAGYAMIRQTLTGGAQGPTITLPPASPVAAGLNNGVITVGVPLSAEQAIAVNSLVGLPVDGILTSQGFYLSIQPATAAVRAARQSPTVILLYMDGGSVQQINMSSILVQ